MPILTIDIPQQTFESLAMEPSALAGTMKVMTALKMYELGQLSSRQAATLASVSHGEFLQLLRTYQVPPLNVLMPLARPSVPCTICPMPRSCASRTCRCPHGKAADSMSCWSSSAKASLPPRKSGS